MSLPPLTGRCCPCFAVTRSCSHGQLMPRPLCPIDLVFVPRHRIRSSLPTLARAQSASWTSRRAPRPRLSSSHSRTTSTRSPLSLAAPRGVLAGATASARFYKCLRGHRDSFVPACRSRSPNQVLPFAFLAGSPRSGQSCTASARAPSSMWTSRPCRLSGASAGCAAAFFYQMCVCVGRGIPFLRFGGSGRVIVKQWLRSGRCDGEWAACPLPSRRWERSHTASACGGGRWSCSAARRGRSFSLT